MAKIMDINSEEYKLGRRIQKYRKARGFTQNQLADLVDMDRANLSGYENGTKGEMGFKTLIKFSEALQVPVDCLVADNDEDADGDSLDSLISQMGQPYRDMLRTVVEGLLLKQDSA